MDVSKIKTHVDSTWDDSILPALKRYIAIPNQSPLFDPQWAANGHLDQAVDLAVEWVKSRQIQGMEMEVVRLPGRTPLIYAEVAGQSQETVLLYGHLDKQPPMLPWATGLDPRQSVIRDGKLYGRGGADDGYAIFGSITAIEALQKQGVPHARCLIIIETCEESGSFDLPAYMEALAPRMGTPSLIVCLDSGCGNYDQLWVTTSLRGIVSGDLKVEVLNEGVHSGDASGIVPSSFRILRQILNRLEDPDTGRVLLEDLWVEIPAARLEQAHAAAAVLGDQLHSKFPWKGPAQPLSLDPAELLLARTWRPQLAITGAAGLPSLESAGNVLRPMSAVKLSLRIPPHLDPEEATQSVRTLLEKDPPYGATITFKAEQGAAGWDAPPLAPWLEETGSQASMEFFGQPVCYMGEGGSIPFMGMLGEKFPAAQFMITGLLGPRSNAHGPNEFLHIDAGKKLTACISRVLANHLKARS